MIYIHIPFCRSWCCYCDFYSEIACRAKDDTVFSSYLSELLREIQERKNEISNSLEINTLYIGGGTPSVLPLSALGRIVESLKEFAPFEEFTIEVNPDDIVAKGIDYARGLKAIGINRVSMGVQSWNDEILAWMNRRHNAECAAKAFAILREAGIENISLDLIFGLSNMTMSQLEYSLKKTCELRPEHISAYQLSIESGSTLGAMVARGEYKEADDEFCAAQYELICRYLASEGYGHYEISSWSLAGLEAVHNSAYWSRKQYIGLGPGAHSFDGLRRRSWNNSSLKDWASHKSQVLDSQVASSAAADPSNYSCNSTTAGGNSKNADSVENNYEFLTEEEILEEKIMLGLRTAKGIDSSLCDPSILRKLLDRGDLIRLNDSRVRIPESRFFVSDEIIAELV